MANKIYTHNNYYFSMPSIFPKSGIEIYNSDSTPTGFIINRESETNSGVLLRYKDTHQEHTDSEFNDILVLVRKYALEKKKYFIIDPELSEQFDVQNFVVHGDAVIPMTGSEIERIYNATNDILKIRKPDIEEEDQAFSFYVRKRPTVEHSTVNLYDFEYLYMVSKGKLDVDINSAFGVHLLSNTSDFSNIVHLKNSNEDEVNVSFRYNGKGAYKFPEHIERDIHVFIHVESIDVLVNETNKKYYARLYLYPPSEHIKPFIEKLRNGNSLSKIINPYHQHNITKNTKDIINYINKHKDHDDFTKDNRSIMALERVHELLTTINDSSKTHELLLEQASILKDELDKKFEHSLEM